MEINVALDELLGFRGPLLALIRNLLWLLLFNTAYLGVFAFTPLKFGGSIHSILSRRLPNIFALLRGNLWESFITSMQELERKSSESNLIYQPSQIAKIGLGYATLYILIFVLQATCAVAVRRGERRRRAAERLRQAEHFMDDPPILEEIRRVAEQNMPDDEQPPGKRILGFLECVGAIAKVVILLLIKMLFLPLLLGVWLDWATLSLFKKTWSDRIEFAGSDLFGSTFLHWVTGITFMLLVTVSVLQLREVAHPDILAGVIRPQEPQPDLLGNLLQESGATHAKRVLLSLGIYAVLLAVHIWIPTRLLMLSNLGHYLPLFRPKFWHVVMPQIQIPIELLLFHVCMLGVLEKYKNSIGEMQHHWLIFMGNYLGITDQILPHEVDRFSLVGSLPVFSKDASPNQLENIFQGSVEEVPPIECSNDDIYPLWNSFLSETDPRKRAELIRSNICRMDAIEAPRYTHGIVQSNGKKLLSSHAYIRLPSASSTSRLAVKTTNDASSNLLPTSIGPYRLRQGVSAGKHRVRYKWLNFFCLLRYLTNFCFVSVLECQDIHNRSLARGCRQAYLSTTRRLG
jgi:E3 ubiquitin-protein ligase MARCH6